MLTKSSETYMETRTETLLLSNSPTFARSPIDHVLTRKVNACRRGLSITRESSKKPRLHECEFLGVWELCSAQSFQPDSAFAEVLTREEKLADAQVKQDVAKAAEKAAEVAKYVPLLHSCLFRRLKYISVLAPDDPKP